MRFKLCSFDRIIWIIWLHNLGYDLLQSYCNLLLVIYSSYSSVIFSCMAIILNTFNESTGSCIGTFVLDSNSSSKIDNDFMNNALLHFCNTWLGDLAKHSSNEHLYASNLCQGWTIPSQKGSFPQLLHYILKNNHLCEVRASPSV